MDSSHTLPSSKHASRIVRTVEEIKEEEDQEVIDSLVKCSAESKAHKKKFVFNENERKRLKARSLR
jgi:hypothetical protein